MALTSIMMMMMMLLVTMVAAGVLEDGTDLSLAGTTRTPGMAVWPTHGLAPHRRSVNSHGNSLLGSRSMSLPNVEVIRGAAAPTFTPLVDDLRGPPTGRFDFVAPRCLVMVPLLQV